MLFVPKKHKYKKHQKGKCFRKIVFKSCVLKHGQVGLKVLHFAKFNSKLLVSLYNNLKKKMKKKGKVIITIFPQTSITKKPVEVRMGKGKGNVAFWAAKVKAGSIICEISTFKINSAINVLNNIRFKLPVKTKVVIRPN